MFTRFQARHFRWLKLIDQRLDRFQALVGPNASGKTTFLDSVNLLCDLMRYRGDVVAAVRMRSADFTKLLWKGQGSSFQIAVEAVIPADAHQQMANQKQKVQAGRYEVDIASSNGPFSIVRHRRSKSHFGAQANESLRVHSRSGLSPSVRRRYETQATQRGDRR
jgi:predicted ATPase